MVSRPLSFAIVMLLSGCAGVFNPYVAPDGAKKVSNEKPLDCTELEESLCSALNLADRYRLAYLKAAGNQQKLRSTFAIAGLVAATSTLYYGLQGRDKYQDRVIRLATLGGASYAAGSFFTSSPRQKVYLNGATAMSCAMIAAAPAMVPKSGQSSLKNDLEFLRNKLAAVQATAVGSTDPVLLRAIADGESTLQSGTEMLVNLTTSGIVLRARIEVLANEVNHQMLEQLPDLNSLYSLAGSMSSFAQTFGSQRLPSTTKKTGPTQSSRGDADLSALQEATTLVKGHLNFAAIASQSFREVAACSPDGITNAFSVMPRDALVTVEKGKTYSFNVTDKRGHPSAKLSGENVDKVELQPIQIQGENYLVVIKGKDVTGTSGPSLLISESSGVQAHALTIMVAAATQAADTPAGKPASKPVSQAITPRNDTIEPAFLKEPLKILAVQCVVGATPDCIMGDKTRIAIRIYKEKQKPGVTGDDAIDLDLQSAAGKLNLPPTACQATPISCAPTP